MNDYSDTILYTPVTQRGSWFFESIRIWILNNKDRISANKRLGVVELDSCFQISIDYLYYV